MDLMEYYLECYEYDLLAGRKAILDATDDELIEAHIKWFNKDNRHKLEKNDWNIASGFVTTINNLLGSRRLNRVYRDKGLPVPFPRCLPTYEKSWDYPVMLCPL